MKIKGRGRTASLTVLTAFWDTSAIVPLCCFQPQTSQSRQAARHYARQVVWWATPIEAISSFNRLVRNGDLTGQESRQAFTRLNHLRGRWNEIQPSEEVREQAERLLGTHKLRAADSLQLAAALVWSLDRPRGYHFICADGDLSDAAEAEGFTAIRLSK
jgi:predicted nucleic acid-binding protein